MPVYIYICRLVTQSVCTRAELSKGRGGDATRCSGRSIFGKEGRKSTRGCKRHPSYLSLVRPFLSGSSQGRRLLECQSSALEGQSNGHFVHTWRSVTSALSRAPKCTKIKRLLATAIRGPSNTRSRSLLLLFLSLFLFRDVILI